MQKISDSTNTANPAGEFAEGNPAAGAPATLIKAAWLNTIQRELAGLVLGAGISLNANDDAQVLKAVKALAGTAADFDKLTNKPTTLSGYGITDGITAAQMNAALAGKASKATTLGGYGITDAVSSNNDNAVVGKISDVNRAQFINGNPTTATTDMPPGVAYFSGIRAKYNGGKLGFDFGCSMQASRSFGRLTLADGSGDWFEYWTSANFDPALKANLAGPTFTGPVRVPNLALGTNDDRAANSAFVQAAVAALVDALAGKASKATTLGGYGIADAYTAAQVDAKTALATEATKGTVVVATTAQMTDGGNDFVVPTPKKLRWGLAYSFVPNGYIALPSWLGGFIIQWGTSAAVPVDGRLAVNYQIEFPSACFIALANYKSGAAVANHCQSFGVANISKTSFQIENQWVYADTPTNFSGVWLAFGY